MLFILTKNYNTCLVFHCCIWIALKWTGQDRTWTGQDLNIVSSEASAHHPNIHVLQRYIYIKNDVLNFATQVWNFTHQSVFTRHCTLIKHKYTHFKGLINKRLLKTLAKRYTYFHAIEGVLTLWRNAMSSID